MTSQMDVRRWSTPLTIGAFLLMSGSGVLMFFELDRGLLTVVHGWFSWAFLVGAAGHVFANFRPLKNHLRTSWGRGSVALFGMLLLLAVSSWGLVTRPQLERPILGSLVDAPLITLAPLARTTPAALVGRMRAHGIAAEEGQSVRQIAAGSGTGIGIKNLLAIVFLPDRSRPPVLPRRPSSSDSLPLPPAGTGPR